ncbi:helix-turn-helix transcriptional regulator [Streptomyces sp. NPDC051909]|uniref:helix-turn-helix domain-containing protein n=1 Tax=Streptomyces sp. NPDC051909 TaxID=3154944 RepID=UPI00344AD9E9
MGRTSNPIPNPNSVTGRLAAHLRDGMALRRLTYRQLAATTRYHATTLQRAAAGKYVSSWEVVREFASACDLDQEVVRGLWKAAYRERQGRRGPEIKPVGVEQINSYAELGVFLVDLRQRKGSPSYRLMERRTLSHWKWFGRLPHSTAQRIGSRQTSRPTLNQVRAFLVGCGIAPEHHGDLVRAWHRANTRYLEDRARGMGKQPTTENTAVTKIVLEHSALQTAHDLGYAPLEPFRGYRRPWSVICRSCGKNRRIRLDWEIQRQQREAGSWDMRCRACADRPAPRPAARIRIGLGLVPIPDPPRAALVSGRGTAR